MHLPSRYEIYLLYRRGEQLVQQSRAQRPMVGLDAWTSEVGALLSQELPASERAGVQHAHAMLDATTTTGLPTPDSVEAALNGTLNALDALARAKLRPTECDDSLYAAFLEGALYEWDREPRTIGQRRSVQQVAKTEELDIFDAQRALARAIDRELMHQRTLGDEFTITDEDLADREVTRMHQRLANSAQTSSINDEVDGDDWQEELTPQRVLDNYTKVLRGLESSQAKTSSYATIKSKDYFDVVGPLDAEACRLIAAHAPELQRSWDAARLGRTELDDELSAFEPSIGIGHVILQMQQRIPTLKALVKRSPMPKTTLIPIPIPPHLDKYREALSVFWEDFDFERSVFVMMKFPDKDSNMKSEHVALLNDMYASVERELLSYGLTARRADERAFEPQLWDNLNVYMIGCKYGIALLEDRVENLLNPNIALEYGYMRALGRSVLLLRERSFKHDRADFIGTLAKPFSVTDDDKLVTDSISRAIDNWAVDLGLPRKKVRL